MDKNVKKRIVISAINFFQGGPLSILNECLGAAQSLSARYDIYVLVHDKSLIKASSMHIIEFKGSRRFWLSRLFYEYVYFYFLSKKLRPYLWLSLHDITPNVVADRLAVYCHNPAPFYKLRLTEMLLEPRFALFNLFYKYLYRINLKKNHVVIVQQENMRKAFKALFKADNVIVANPDINVNNLNEAKAIASKMAETGNKGVYTFIYPAFPRSFKNHEVICEAARLLQSRGIDNLEILFTINGKENGYARRLFYKYEEIKAIKFIGPQSRRRIYEYYSEVDGLLFPSKLETWGLPISEFKYFEKPILLADLDYAHETLGGYDKAIFFDPNDRTALAELMQTIIEGRIAYRPVRGVKVPPPFAANWKELFDFLLPEKPAIVGSVTERKS